MILRFYFVLEMYFSSVLFLLVEGLQSVFPTNRRSSMRQSSVDGGPRKREKMHQQHVRFPNKRELDNLHRLAQIAKSKRAQQAAAEQAVAAGEIVSTELPSTRTSSKEPSTSIMNAMDSIKNERKSETVEERESTTRIPTVRFQLDSSPRSLDSAQTSRTQLESTYKNVASPTSCLRSPPSFNVAGTGPFSAGEASTDGRSPSISVPRSTGAVPASDGFVPANLAGTFWLCLGRLFNAGTSCNSSKDGTHPPTRKDSNTHPSGSPSARNAIFIPRSIDGVTMPGSSATTRSGSKDPSSTPPGEESLPPPGPSALTHPTLYHGTGSVSSYFRRLDDFASSGVVSSILPKEDSDRKSDEGIMNRAAGDRMTQQVLLLQDDMELGEINDNRHDLQRFQAGHQNLVTDPNYFGFPVEDSTTQGNIAPVKTDGNIVPGETETLAESRVFRRENMRTFVARVTQVTSPEDSYVSKNIGPHNIHKQIRAAECDPCSPCYGQSLSPCHQPKEGYDLYAQEKRLETQMSNRLENQVSNRLEGGCGLGQQSDLQGCLGMPGESSMQGRHNDYDDTCVRAAHLKDMEEAAVEEVVGMRTGQQQRETVNEGRITGNLVMNNTVLAVDRTKPDPSVCLTTPFVNDPNNLMANSISLLMENPDHVHSGGVHTVNLTNSDALQHSWRPDDIDANDHDISPMSSLPCPGVRILGFGKGAADLLNPPAASAVRRLGNVGSSKSESHLPGSPVNNSPDSCPGSPISHQRGRKSVYSAAPLATDVARTSGGSASPQPSARGDHFGATRTSGGSAAGAVASSSDVGSAGSSRFAAI